MGAAATGACAANHGDEYLAYGFIVCVLEKAVLAERDGAAQDPTEERYDIRERGVNPANHWLGLPNALAERSAYG